MMGLDEHRCSATLLGCLVLALGLSAAPVAAGDHFEIIFEEGAFPFRPPPEQDLDAAWKAAHEQTTNKYLARVTVRRNGDVVAQGIRGSTLPDAPLLYLDWHEQGEGLWRDTSPDDSDVVKVCQHLQALADEGGGPDPAAPEIFRRVSRAYRDVWFEINSLPVLPSGTYCFTMGLHGGGSKYHGHPYVPRLLGGPARQPYDGGGRRIRPASCARLLDGGAIRTLNPNAAHDGAHMAAGINIHDGRRTLDYRDSEGCLTIHPDDWGKFYMKLPSPDEWRAQGHTGIVTIRR